MPVPRASQIHPGTLVSLIQKQDQPTGRQVQGTVADLLTRGDHPRGIKVRLTDGRIGRVQGLVSAQTAFGQASVGAGSEAHMAHQQGGYGQGQGYANAGQQSQYAPSPPLPHRPSQQQPYAQQQALYPQYNNHQPASHYEADPQRAAAARAGAGVAAQDEAAAQVEHFQVFEQGRSQTQQERDQQALEKEFPKIDGSLIAALYGDLEGDMSGCREMLQMFGQDQS